MEGQGASSTTLGARRGAAVVAAIALFVTLTALLDGTHPGTEPAVRVTFTVPPGFLVVAGGLFVLAWLVILVAARGSRRLEDEAEPAGTRLPLSWWGHVIAQIVLLLPFVATVLALWLDGGRVAGALLVWGRGWLYAVPPETGGAEVAVVALPWLGWTLGLVAVGTALLALGVGLVVLFGERILAWWLARRRAADVRQLTATVDEGLEALTDAVDPRVAIIRCYRRFEHAAARARVRRAPWQTASEFMLDACSRLALPHAAVARLTRLFEVARFSQHPVRAGERDEARASLEAIRAALEPTEDPAAVA